MKTVVFAFGRMNPPTTGHQKLAAGLVAHAKKAKATPRIYLSHSVGKKDPLPYDKKIAFAKKAFGAIVKKSPARNVIQILQSLEKEGFKKVVLIAGSDRVPEFTKLLKAYNGKEYNFDEIEVVSAGERDPDADDVSGMSASKLRALAKDGNEAEFMRGAPSTLKTTDKKSLYTAVRRALLGEDVMDYGHDEKFTEFMIESAMKDDDHIEGMPSDAEIKKIIDDMEYDDLDLHDTDALMLDVILGEPDEDEEEDEEEMDEERKPLSIGQRQKMSQRLKRMAKRLARLRQIKAKMMPAQQRIRLRARKAALMSLRKRAAGTRGLTYSELSPSQRIAVDSALYKRFGANLNKAVDRISKRLLPAIRKKAQASVAQARSRSQTNEAVTKQDSPLSVDATKLNVLDTDPMKNDRTAPDPKNAHTTKHKHLIHKHLEDDKEIKEARKSAVDKDARDAGDTNIVYQMRKTINSRGEHETVFANGQKSSISVNDAKKMLARFDALRLPADKHDFTVEAGKSLSSFRNILMHGLDKSKKPKISLGGRSFKEFRAYNKYQPDEPPGTRLVGEAKEDPEIGDRKGVQPAQYHSGLKKSTKIARDQQFKKQSGMSDSDPSAYKPAPGDDSETRPSKHTLKYRRMYGEAKSSVGGVDPDANDDPNVPRKVDPKLDLLLRLGLVDVDELQKYRRALRSSKKQALQSPEMRKKLADLLDKLLDYTVGDTQTFSRIRYNVQKDRSESVEIDEAADAGLAKKAEKSGIPLSILRQVYNRGMAAWKTGHRPGANQQQWAYARVNSFIGKGKGTWGGRDSDLAAKVRKEEYESLNNKFEEACWSGYKQVGLKKKGDKMVPNCVPNESSDCRCEGDCNCMKEAKSNWDKARKDNERTSVAYLNRSKKSYVNRSVEPLKKDLAKVGSSSLSDFLAKGGKINRLPPGKKSLSTMIKPKKYMTPNQAAKIGVTEGNCNMTNEGTMCEVHGTKACPTVSEGLQRTADIKMVKTRLPDGRIVFRKSKTTTDVQNEQMSKKGWKHHLNPKLSLKHKMKDAMRHVDRDADGDVDKFDKPEFPDEIPVGSEKLNRKMRQKQKGELQHVKIGRAFESKKTPLEIGTDRIRKAYAAATPGQDIIEAPLLTHIGKKGKLNPETGKTFSPKPRTQDTKIAKADDEHDIYHRKHSNGADSYHVVHRNTGKVVSTIYGNRTRNKTFHIDTTDSTGTGPKAHEVYHKILQSGHSTSLVGHSHSEGGQKIWQKLSSRRGVSVHGWHKGKPVNLDPKDPQDTHADEDETDDTAKKVRQTKLIASLHKRKTVKESYDLNEAFSAGFELAPLAHEYGIQAQGGFVHHPDVQEMMDEATYKGKTVPLNKPMKGDVKKSKVYVDPDGDGKAQKVNFGDKTLSIKKNIPARKKSYCARSSGQGNLTDKTKANYWSRRAWDC